LVGWAAAGVGSTVEIDGQVCMGGSYSPSTLKMS